ncbi:MAG TPA: hypothetical protein VGL53_16110 [Bryobacteraceae bacterium]
MDPRTSPRPRRRRLATVTPTTTTQKAASEGLFQLFVEMAPERLSKIEAALSGQDRYSQSP